MVVFSMLILAFIVAFILFRMKINNEDEKKSDDIEDGSSEKTDKGDSVSKDRTPSSSDISKVEDRMIQLDEDSGAEDIKIHGALSEEDS